MTPSNPAMAKPQCCFSRPLDDFLSLSSSLSLVMTPLDGLILTSTVEPSTFSHVMYPMWITHLRRLTGTTLPSVLRRSHEELGPQRPSGPGLGPRMTVVHL
ncbi:Uncharacterized protein TCM_046069 [Theobroma cacao]|uniref:Uncharacterized protein n=1 Tax=Theobroma cacao TaxID=3641 RepID=S1RWG4_THECC|nr:Uncharacterized protein TCM_046069 [Theobroma cacao]